MMRRDDASAFELRSAAEAGGGALALHGRVGLDDVPSLMAQLSRDASDTRALELDELDHIDAGAVALLVQWCEQQDVELVAAREDLGRLVALMQRTRPETVDREPPPGVLEVVGRSAVATYDAAISAVSFYGELLHGLGRAIRHPRSVRWVDLPRLIQRVGADGLAIVCLMSGLLGLVTGYQGAMQLQRFGAASYTANLVGLAMVRELAPLMTAIVVTGRSGAAFAAELATMKVSEEVDALRTMGFSPQGFLVLPRCLALLLALPVLTLVADVASIFGALLIASLVIDASPVAFLIQTQKAVGASDIVAGILKSVFYAQAIGFIACHQGLSASGGAEGVGLRTTKTVVGTLVVLVVIDALLTVLFHELAL